MPVPYARIENCLDAVPSLQKVIENSNELEAALFQSILDASRQFESEAGADVDYFAAAGANFSNYLIYGNGTSFLRLPPFTEIEKITDSDGEVIDVEDYIVAPRRGFYIESNTGSCSGKMRWRRNAKFIVSGKWGFPCVPHDIRVAVKSLALLKFFTNTGNRVGIDNGLSDKQESRLKNDYNRILGIWQSRLTYNLGIP
jgi:hypothetical protein